MKVIGITGFKKAGKDASAQELRKMFLPARTVQVNFADALKEEVAKACGVTVEYINANKDIFRTILQWWGTEFRRKLSGDEYWIIKWMERANKLTPTPDYLICTDVRFINEAAVIRQLSGTIIRIERPGITSDGHASEVEQLQIHTDFTVLNDGTIEELKQKLKTKLNGLHIS